MHSRENLKDLEEPTANLNHHLTMKAIAAAEANHLTIYLANLMTIVIQIKHHVHQKLWRSQNYHVHPKVLMEYRDLFWHLAVESVLDLFSHIGVLLRISIA